MTKDDIIRSVSNGARFTVDIVHRKAFLNSKPVRIEPTDAVPLQEALSDLVSLYHVYRHSVPTTQSERRRHPFFRALPIERLTSEDMLYAPPRNLAQCELELSLFLYIQNQSLTWNEDVMGNGWFYTDSSKHFILRRSWLNS